MVFFGYGNAISVCKGETLAAVGWVFQLVQHGNCIISGGNSASSLLVLYQLLCSQTEGVCSFAGKYFRSR